MDKRHIFAKSNAQHGTFAIIITALLTAFLILIFNTSCSKADEITPIATTTPASPNYALLDYQDTAHIAYAMRTDLLEYNNIYFQLKGGGHLLLYSFNHLNAEEPSDTIKLVTPESFAENHQGVVAIMQSGLDPSFQTITRGEVIIHHAGDQYNINILGATESGLGFRSQYTGPIHDLTSSNNQGGIEIGDESISFHLGILSHDGDNLNYHLIGSNPYTECIIKSSVDIAGKKLPISNNPIEIENGTAVGFYTTLPNGQHHTATSGTIQCSCYGNIYTLIISATFAQGSTTGHFTGPIYLAGK